MGSELFNITSKRKTKYFYGVASTGAVCLRGSVSRDYEYAVMWVYCSAMSRIEQNGKRTVSPYQVPKDVLCTSTFSSTRYRAEAEARRYNSKPNTIWTLEVVPLEEVSAKRAREIKKLSAIEEEKYLSKLLNMQEQDGFMRFMNLEKLDEAIEKLESATKNQGEEVTCQR